MILPAAFESKSIAQFYTYSKTGYFLINDNISYSATVNIFFGLSYKCLNA